MLRRRASSPRLRAIAIAVFLLQVSTTNYIGNCQTPALVSDTYSRRRYEEGYCSMYDICGQRSDGKVLNCPNVTQAVKPDKLLSSKIQSLCPTITGNICCTASQFDTLRAEVQKAIPFLIGCPACLRNFLNLYCELSCSPNQSLFINVTSVTKVKNISAVNGIEFYLSESFGEGLYNSCKDVKFGTMNTRAMDFIGAGAQNYEEWLAFMGRQAGPGEFGSPYFINFRSNISQLSGMRPLSISAYSCGDSSLGCSCGDCPASPLCSGSPTPSSHQKRSCTIKIGKLKVKCLDFIMAILYIFSMLSFTGILLFLQRRKRNDPSFRGESPLNVKVENELSTKKEGNSDEYLQIRKSENQMIKSFQASFIQRHITSFFREYGKWVVRHQMFVLCSSLLIPIFLCIGLVRFNVETRPEKLWVGSGSRAANEKQFFDSNLAPFYRIEQLIIATTPFEVGKSPKIVTDSNLQLLFDIQKKVDDLQANYSGVSVSLADICLKPLGNACATQSVLQYFKMDPAIYGEYGGVEHIDYCLQHYSSAERCLSAFKAPLDPSTALGGFSGTNYSEASAFVITYPVNNAFDLTGNENGKAIAWEKAFVRLVEAEIVPMVESQNLTISFSSESSVQEELKRESNADAITVLISYLVMFFYIAFTLGDISNFSSLVVSSKALLGFSGVVVVLLSVGGSIGFFSAIGVKSTLIIMEVIPFLVLAVGVDNMCILVHAVKRQPFNLPMESRLSNALAEVGPSITLASVSEVLAFAVGSFIPMPACRVFSMFAALAIFLDFLLQVSAFVVLITFDLSRTEANRVDCFPCIKLPTRNSHVDKDIGQRNPGLLVRYMKDIHGPILSLRGVKIVVVAVFVAFAFASIALSLRIQAGLEQKIVLPRDSYLQGYFNNLSEYLRVGPPLYFVVKDFNYSMSSSQTNQLCSISQCDSDSLLNEISRASLTPELSYVAKPAASWLDDFLVWLSPDAFGCCRKFTNGSYCPPDDQPPCCPGDQASCGLGAICKDCTTCFLHSDMLKGRPSTLQFREKLPWFLNALPSSDCAKGGRGAYSTNVDLNGYESGTIRASAFRTYHTPLNKQIDYVNALRAARDFSARASNSLKIEIFPYSVFYIFFEQYLNIWRTALINMSIALGAVFVVCLVITGSFWSSAIILLVLAMIVVDIMGVMAILGIQLNAISVVNLVMSVGIAVEFCVHIVHAFSVTTGNRDHRAKEALSTMGASVFSGITLTKLVGVIVLRFAKSEIFVVYYFQMYLALVLIGFLHGLVFLPVLLSLCGPPSKMVLIESRQENPPTATNQGERDVIVNGVQDLDR